MISTSSITPFNRSFAHVLRSAAAIVAAGLLAGACQGSQAPREEAAPASAPPAAEAPAPAEGPRLYVSDETGRDVVVIDAAKGEVAGRIEVGKRPRALQLTNNGTQLLIALSGSPIAGPGVDESKLPPADRAADGIGLVDVASGKLIRKFNSGDDPEAFDISPDGKTLYVSNEDSAQMSVLDLASGNVTARVKVGEEPEGVTVRPDGKVVYVSCEGTGEVVAVDTATNEVIAHIKTAARPRSIAFTDDGATAFVASENGGAVTVVDGQKHTVLSTITVTPTPGTPTPPRPMGTVMSPDGKELYVSLGRSKGVAIIDVASRTLKRTIEDVGDRPWGIGISPDGKTLYTANGPSGDVSIIDIASGKVEKRVSTGGSPWGVAVGAAK